MNKTKTTMSYEDELREHLARKHASSHDRRHAEALAAQKEIARHNQNSRSIEGLGRAVMEVDSRVYNEWTRKEGKDIWKDKSFREYIARENPELKVNSKGTGKVQVGYGS